MAAHGRPGAGAGGDGVPESPAMTDDLEAAMADLLLLREIEAFLVREAALLDERRLGEWAALFAADGHYWAPASPDQEDPFEAASLFFDDATALRARYGEAGGGLPPSRTSHLVSNVTIESQNRRLGAFEVGARFVLVEAQPGRPARTFAGRAEYALLRKTPPAFEIAAKKATIVNPEDIAFPIALPF